MKTEVARDDEGYLVVPEDWNEDIAAKLAREEGIELNDEYWRIFEFIRGYYNLHAVIPDVRHVTDYLASKKQVGKKEAKKLLFDLFPYGYVKQACKIAGMKKPRAWSTG